MIQTDLLGDTRSDCAIVGSATFAIAASSTASTIAASTAAIAAVRCGSGSPVFALAVCPGGRHPLRSTVRAGDDASGGPSERAIGAGTTRRAMTPEKVTITLA